MKSVNFAIKCTSLSSPPSWWSGLKYRQAQPVLLRSLVSTLVVEWIEILHHYGQPLVCTVSTIVVEWIEMDRYTYAE